MSDYPKEIQEDVEELMRKQKVVEIKSDTLYNIYLKEYDESFSCSGLNAEIHQVHPRKRNDTPFAVRLLMKLEEE